jgi:hypothetical protein
MDYLCFKVGDAAAEIAHRGDRPLHKAFAAHLRKVETALHDLEWVWSGDYGAGDEDAAIQAVIAPGDETAAAINMARKACGELAKTLQRLSEK